MITVLAAAEGHEGGFSPELALLIGAVVVLIGVLSVRTSTRYGLPSLLIFLAIGMLMGEDVIGLSFSDADLARQLGLWALVLILAEGGLVTRWDHVKSAVPLALVVSTLGVAISTAVTGAFAVLLIGLDWRTGLLLGAVVSSTDAAAVFSTLRRLTLGRRLTALLELESGFNDAPAVIFVVLLSGSTVFDRPGPFIEALGLLAYELVVGAVIGAAVGWLGGQVLKRLALPVAGLYPLAAVAFTVAAYAGTTLLHASGFLAVYLAGLVLGNSKPPHRQATLGFAEGLAWLAQIGLFVLLGLLVTPHQLGNAIVPALVIGGALLLVARPLSVFGSLSWFRMPWREQAFLSWTGLRGAVPIVLATIPVTSGLPDGQQLFDIVFVLVVLYTLLQGTTLPAMARLLKVTDPVQPTELQVESAPLGELGADLLQFEIPDGSKMHGVYVDELRLPGQAVISLLIRDGAASVPGDRVRLVTGDRLLIVATDRARDATERRLRAVARRGRLARWFGETGDPVEAH